ncbi:TetR/AcrR family transcriptional regulator [Pseudomonas sp. HN11]|uniref:TetR/AcrR family transcriptional regulator n=1 Tax=Pseudomonas sp. HN11 TaxID=1344094 RepID=UPI001F25E506|nr:TetR/AcrR family transcriptional regulator [Pseudomonas sp. HN11]UII69641.1 TetR/AcrR family transcriptional regulator [Pseudomonas sp. HN11]
MKVTKEQSMLNKDKILTAASKLYREYGVHGIGIAKLSKTVGLTHGSFYQQFPNGKEQLVSEAIIHTFDEYCKLWSAELSAKSLVKKYVSSEHQLCSQNGCPIPTLAADVTRMGGTISDAFTDGVRKLLVVLMEKNVGQSEPNEERAMQLMSSMAGAMLIAGALNDCYFAEKFMSSVINLWCNGTEPLL